MNVEEKDLHDAVVTAGSKLSNFHMCENDRGIPGTGHVDWDGICLLYTSINKKDFNDERIGYLCRKNMF